SVSSGNVFADLGVSDPDEALLKAKLAQRISELIVLEGWTQAQAASVLDIDQPKISALMRGRLSGFSTDRLFRWLINLGQDVEITVTPKSPSEPRGRITVTSSS